VSSATGEAASLGTDEGMTTLCLVGDLADGQARRVLIGTHPVAVFRIGDNFHVTDDTCTHGFASLAEGDIEGCRVFCPWHGGAFDVTTGDPVGEPCTVALKTYACSVRDGRVQLNQDEFDAAQF
jgi:nitrite reductase/ring-hydroxylating ferredoxin subunit